MKLNNTQINALIDKLYDEINDKIKKELPNKLKEATETFKSKEPKKLAQYESYMEVIAQIDLLELQKSRLEKDIEKWYKNNIRWNNNFDTIITNYYDLDNQRISTSQIKQDIVLATIESNDMDEIIKTIKNKYINGTR